MAAALYSEILLSLYHKSTSERRDVFNSHRNEENVTFYFDFVDLNPKIGFVKRVFYPLQTLWGCTILALLRSQDVIARSDMYCSEVSWKL